MKLKNNFSTKKKIIILTTTLSLIVVTICVFLLYPYYSEIQTQNTEIKDKRIQLAIYQEQRKNIDKTRTDLKKIEKDSNSLSLIFLEQEDILDFVDTLESISGKNNLEQNLELTNIESFQIDKNLMIGITLNGQWDDIMNYLNTLEILDQYVILDNLNFSKNGINIKLTFTAIIYSS
ncbi:MAG: hypothetical protein ACNFW9_01895 [Candidatus Kerfeldbacteria bacterium]|jgi:Tfp pilus assembly protein PilO